MGKCLTSEIGIPNALAKGARAAANVPFFTRIDDGRILFFSIAFRSPSAMTIEIDAQISQRKRAIDDVDASRVHFTALRVSFTGFRFSYRFIRSAF